MDSGKAVLAVDRELGDTTLGKSKEGFNASLLSPGTSLRLVSLLVLLVALTVPAVSLDLNSSYELRYFPDSNMEFQVDTNGNIDAKGNLDMGGGNSVLNYWDSGTECGADEAVYGIYDNGSYKCTSTVATGQDVENLSLTLQKGNVANQSINMSGNNVTDLAGLLFQGDKGIEIGDSSTVTGHYSAVAVGRGADAAYNGAVAIGDSASTGAYSTAAIAIGDGSSASQAQSIAIGQSTRATSRYATALGYTAQAGGQSSLGLGDGVTASADSSVAIGDGARAYGVDSIAIGTGADVKSSADYSVAIGTGAKPQNSYEATFGGFGDANSDGTTDRLDLNVTGNTTIHGIGGLNLEKGHLNFDTSSENRFVTGSQGQQFELKNTGELAATTDGSGSGEFFVWDKANGQKIARFQEGGNVKIPNGDLNMSDNLIVDVAGIAGGDDAVGIANNIHMSNNDDLQNVRVAYTDRTVASEDGIDIRSDSNTNRYGLLEFYNGSSMTKRGAYLGWGDVSANRIDMFLDHADSFAINGGDLDMYGNNITNSQGSNVSIGDSLKVYGNVWTSGADLAEIYRSGQVLEPGEVVAISQARKDSVVRTDGAYRETAMGVVSDNPSHVMNAGEKGYPVTLEGKVHVRISEENGVIEKGDRLSPSSEPGVAMKCETIDPAESDMDLGDIISHNQKCRDATFARSLENSEGKQKILALVD